MIYNVNNVKKICHGLQKSGCFWKERQICTHLLEENFLKNGARDTVFNYRYRDTDAVFKKF